jgi:hypothetical protein
MFDIFTSRNVKKKSFDIHSHVRPKCPTKTKMSDQIVGLRECWLSNLSDILGGICRTWEYDRWYTWSVLYMLIFRRIFLSNYWWQKSDIWSQASYRYAILWETFLDPSDSYFLFAGLVGFYTHWTYMHIYRHIFLSYYWWQRSDIWSQASYWYPILWEAFSSQFILFLSGILCLDTEIKSCFCLGSCV